MANYDHVVIRSDNTEIIKQIATDYRHFDEFIQSSPYELSMTIRNGSPHTQLHNYLRVLSEKAEAPIIAEVQFEHDYYTQKHIIQYSNGTEEQIGLEPEYMTSCGQYHSIPDETINSWFDKAILVLRRLDTISRNDDGSWDINSPEGEVFYSFEEHGYKVVTTKIGLQVNMAIYRRTGPWEEVDRVSCVGFDDIPF